MLQEEAPWTGLCCVLEEDPLLRMGAPASTTTIMSTSLLEFTVSKPHLCLGAADRQPVNAQGGLTHTHGNTLAVFATNTNTRIELEIVAHH